MPLPASSTPSNPVLTSMTFPCCTAAMWKRFSNCNSDYRRGLRQSLNKESLHRKQPRYRCEYAWRGAEGPDALQIVIKASIVVADLEMRSLAAARLRQRKALMFELERLSRFLAT
jgi:hypothetical protein